MENNFFAEHQKFKTPVNLQKSTKNNPKNYQ